MEWLHRETLDAELYLYTVPCTVCGILSPSKMLTENETGTDRCQFTSDVDDGMFEKYTKDKENANQKCEVMLQRLSWIILLHQHSGTQFC